MKVTPEELLDRWSHAAAAVPVDRKTWAGILTWYIQWMSRLKEQKVKTGPRHLTDEQRTLLEHELAWAVADLSYLSTGIRLDPLVPAPSASRRAASSTPHPFVHLVFVRRHKDRKCRK